MTVERLRTRALLSAALAVCALVLSPTSRLLAAGKETLLHSFNGGDGIYPEAADLVADGAGNLYGTTYYGGANGDGVVFELESSGNGKWVQKVLYSFNRGGQGGYAPKSGLIFDTVGNLYGTTTYGGPPGFGTVFELTPNGDGTWSEKVVHGFTFKDGSAPYGGLVFDAAGNLYGTTYYGGSGKCQAFETTVGCGVVFELTPGGNGKWTEKVLHNFSPGSGDGHYPQAGLVRDAAGNLYGTTFEGGAYNTGCGGGGCGTAFRLTPGAKGRWSETIVHNFDNDGTDGYLPITRLIVDKAGNLYGTTPYGGCSGGYCGVAFKLTPGGAGKWTESVLHTFLGVGNDGRLPVADLVSDKAGNLYGTTYYGGASSSGTAFELKRNSKGKWVIELLYTFDYSNGGGDGPSAGLVFGKAGNLYGTTYYGGTYGDGIIFEVSP
jgi:uncharacterized repeat protein (TIGR03803 family)